MHYIFDPDTLQEIAKKGMGLPYEQMFETVRVELEQKYPGRINNKIQWMFNNAGGCMYSVAVLHASLTEYILIFGSPIGTQGHTGRHFAEIYDFVMDGELWYFGEDRPFERIVRKSGDQYYLGKLESEGLRIPNHAWVLEYARGFIPSMLPFGMADSLLSTLDIKTVARTFGIYGKLLLKNSWQQFKINSLPSDSKKIL
jgi:C-8 sterol isomerase